MARRTNDKIRARHLILCEGRDAEEMLIAYLNSEELKEEPAFSNDFQVMDFGGNEDLARFLALLQKMEGYDRVSSLLIVRDAERDADTAIREIRGVLCRQGLAAPEGPHRWQGDMPKVGYLLFPTCAAESIPGTLEDLCLSILAEADRDELLGDIQRFIDQLSADRGRTFPREFKTKLHTYFSITDAYVSLKMGESARVGAFDWASEQLRPLRDFLTELL